MCSLFLCHPLPCRVLLTHFGLFCFGAGGSVAGPVVLVPEMCHPFSSDCLLVRGISANLVRGLVYRSGSA